MTGSIGRRVWIALLTIAALRAAWLAVALIAGGGDVRRHHVESAAFIAAGLLVLTAIWYARRAGATSTERAALPLTVIGGVATAALALYYPVLSVGLLSDDFLLVQWAAAGDIVPAAWEMVRPVPLAIWAAIGAVLPADAMPVALHALNLALHIVNALLVMGLARPLGLTRERALAAGLIFVAWPLNAETVAWAAAIFDLLLVTCALLLASLALAPQTPRTIGAAAAVTIVALLTKETAVILPAIAGLAVMAVGNTPHRSGVVLVSAAMTVVYALLRVTLKATAVPDMPPLSAYAFKEMIGRPFAALIVPVHVDVAAALPSTAMVPIVAVTAIAVAGAIGWRWHPERARRALCGTAWILVGVSPLLTNLFVGADLQGARYLYLPMVAWALMLADGLPFDRFSGKAASLVVMLILLAACALAGRAHVGLWTAAAELRDRTLDDLLARVPSCGTNTVTVPVDAGGPYVFVNGLAEALQTRGVAAVAGPKGSARVGECQIVPARSLSPAIER